MTDYVEEFKQPRERWTQSYFNWTDNPSDDELHVARDGFDAGAICMERRLLGDEFIETSVLSKEAAEIVRCSMKHNCCIAVKVEGDMITFVTGDLRIRTKLKSDFPPNTKFSPDFNDPRIKDWGGTIAFGDYEADFSKVI